MKPCNMCGLVKETFPSYKNRCKDCVNIKRKEWELKNPDRRREYKREWQRKPEQVEKRKIKHRERAYKLSETDYQTMLGEQGHLCKLCENPLIKGYNTIHIDHCHETGRVRGILCQPCNQGIGFLRHDEEILRKAIVYVKKTS